MKLPYAINKDKSLRFLYTLLAGLLGGFVFSFFHLPLPWVLGPMVFSIILTMTVEEAYAPPSGRLFGFFILGIALGLYFVPEMGIVILSHFDIVIITTLITLILGLLNGYIFKKIFNLDWMTAIFGSIPGGLVQMVEIGGELGGKREIIAIQQTLRVILVVVIIPSVLLFVPQSSTPASLMTTASSEFDLFQFILLIGLGGLGVIIGKFMRMPILFMMGPMVVVAVVSLCGVSLAAIPSPLLHSAQMFIGISIALNFKRSNLLEYRKYLLLGLFAGITLTAMSFMTAWLLKVWANLDWLTAILSTAPGGIAEMSVTAVAVNAAVPLVAAFQIVRMILAMVVLPKIIVIILRKNRVKSETLGQ